MAVSRKSYPSDVSDDEWSLVMPYLTLMTEDAPQREYPLRKLFNALRYVVRYAIAWRAMPNDLPPWSAVYQQSQRWLAAGCFEALAHDLQCELIAAESGTKFQVTETSRALAVETVLTGRYFTAEEALAANVINRVAPHGTYLDVAHDLARAIAENPP